MNKIERSKINDIYRDCKNLEKEGNLTEYGMGQRDLCKILMNKIMKGNI